MELVHVTGVLAAGLTIVFAWPQAWRSYRAPDVDGVSVATTALILFSGLSWWLYGVLIKDWAIIAADFGTLTATTFTLVVLSRRGRPVVRPLGALVVAWAAVFGASLVVLGEAGPGVLGSVLGIAMTMPQAWRSLRGHGTEGVALSTYGLLLAMTISWLAYGFLTSNLVIVVPNLFAVTVTSLVLVALVLQRRREQPRLEPLGSVAR